MRKYEVIYILDTAKGEETIKSLVEKFTSLISQNGEVEKVEEWGNKQLAYEVDGKREGYYVFTTFAANGDFTAELERQFKITDGVVKYLVVRKDA